MNQYIHYFVNGRQVAIPAEYAHLIQMKSRKELAAEYNIPVALLKERIKQMPNRPSSKKVLPIADVIEVYLELGWPLNGR
jgi:hypothetical protein